MSIVSEKLLEAREKMNNGGKHWVRGTLRRKNPSTQEISYCSVGAIQAIPGDRATKNKLYRALNEALPKNFRATGFGSRPPGIEACKSAIIHYNDHWDRKWGDISRVFRRAARLAERDSD